MEIYIGYVNRILFKCIEVLRKSWRVLFIILGAVI